MENQLDRLRDKVDQYDIDLLDALLYRLELVRQIAKLKTEMNVPIFSPERERVIVQQIRDKCPPHLQETVCEIFGHVLQVSRDFAIKVSQNEA